MTIAIFCEMTRMAHRVIVLRSRILSLSGA
jgi:hypothetical protein